MARCAGINPAKVAITTIIIKAENKVNKSIDALYKGIFLFPGIIISLRTIKSNPAKTIPPKPAIKVNTTDSNQICPRI